MNFKMTFGRYKGQPVCDLPRSYLKWLVLADNPTARKCRAKRTEDYEAAKLELVRRKPDKKNNQQGKTTGKDNTVRNQIITARRNMFRYFQAQFYCESTEGEKTLSVRIPKAMVYDGIVTGRLVLIEGKQVIAILLGEVMVDDVENLGCPQVMSWVDTEAYQKDTAEFTQLVVEATDAAKLAKKLQARHDSDTFLVETVSDSVEKGSLLEGLVSKIKQVGDA